MREVTRHSKVCSSGTKPASPGGREVGGATTLPISCEMACTAAAPAPFLGGLALAMAVVMAGLAFAVVVVMAGLALAVVGLAVAPMVAAAAVAAVVAAVPTPGAPRTSVLMLLGRLACIPRSGPGFGLLVIDLATDACLPGEDSGTRGLLFAAMAACSSYAATAAAVSESQISTKTSISSACAARP